MSLIEQLEAQANAGHADTDLVGVPVATIRTLATKLRRLETTEAQLRAATGINRVCQELAR